MDCGVTLVQLLLWTLSGVYFAFIDIDYVRGNQFKRSGDAVAFNFSDIDLPAIPATELTLKERLPGEVIIGLMTEEGPYGSIAKGVLKPLTVEQAITLASSATLLTPDRAEWLDSDVAGSEYRAPLCLCGNYGIRNRRRGLPTWMRCQVTS